MGIRGPTGSYAGLAILCVLIVLLATRAGGVGPPVGVGEHRGPLVETTGSAAVSAELVALDPQVAEGSAANFVLTINGVECSIAPPATDAVRQVVFDLGDGYMFQTHGVLNETSCRYGVGWENVSLTYVYHAVGTVNVSAVVSWGGGPNVSSNTVVVDVLPASTSTSLHVEQAVALLGLLVVAMASLLLLLRRFLPPPPTLRPSEI